MGVLDDLLAGTGLFQPTGADLGLPVYVPYDYYPDPGQYNAPTIQYVEACVKLIKEHPEKAPELWVKLQEIFTTYYKIPVEKPTNILNPTTSSVITYWKTKVNSERMTLGPNTLSRWGAGGVLERATNTVAMIDLVIKQTLWDYPQQYGIWTGWSLTSAQSDANFCLKQINDYIEDDLKLLPRGISAEKAAEIIKQREADAAKPWDPLGLGDLKETGKTLLMVGAVVAGVALLLSVAD